MDRRRQHQEFTGEDAEWRHAEKRQRAKCQPSSDPRADPDQTAEAGPQVHARLLGRGPAPQEQSRPPATAAGPVARGASADTDLTLQAEILTYSRSRGVFAGIALNGATLRPDKESNTELYGSGLTNKQIVMGGAKRSPAAAAALCKRDAFSIFASVAIPSVGRAVCICR